METNTQWDLYALGAEGHFGAQVARQTVHFLADDTVWTWEWTNERRANAQTRLAENLTQVAERAFEPRTGY